VGHTDRVEMGKYTPGELIVMTMRKNWITERSLLSTGAAKVSLRTCEWQSANNAADRNVVESSRGTALVVPTSTHGR
jgi:hypothetical protein